jgi:methyl-accepting chemotaxis protein
VTDRIGRESSETPNRAREASYAATLVSDSVRSVSAATEVMTVSVAEIARGAAHAAEVARNAVAVANRTNGGMEALGVSSVQIVSVVEVEDISRIITEIDEIQTTIAAAVEEQTATTQEIGRNLAEAAGASEPITSTIETVAVSAKNTSEGVGQALVSLSKLEHMDVELGELVGRFLFVVDPDGKETPHVAFPSPGPPARSGNRQRAAADPPCGFPEPGAPSGC